MAARLGADRIVGAGVGTGEETGVTKSREAAVEALTAPGAPFELADLVIDGVPWRVFRHAAPSLRDVLVTTGAYGDKEFLVFEDERSPFAEHLQLVAGLAAHLRDRYGVAKGDRVAIGARNYPEWTISFWATISLGAVAVPLNAWWTGPELEYALADSGAKVAVLDGERVERLRDHLANLAGLRGIVSRHRG